MNAGVQNASAPYVLLHDADVVPPGRYLEAVIVRLEAGWDSVRPSRLIFHLDQAGSEMFLNSGARAAAGKSCSCSGK